MANLLIPNNCNVNFVASQPLSKNTEAKVGQQSREIRRLEPFASASYSEQVLSRSYTDIHTTNTDILSDKPVTMAQLGETVSSLADMLSLLEPSATGGRTLSRPARLG